jgi:hypothetical protein
MFKNILFWCEFPEKTEWDKLNFLLLKYNLKIRTYVAVKNIKEYNEIKKRKLSNIKIEGAWPTLSFGEGYWFSGFCSKKAINSLYQFKGCKIKLDIEAPIPINKSFKNKVSLIFSSIKSFLKSGKNCNYLRKKLRYLLKDTSIILSTYPLPKFILNRLGFLEDKRLKYNYFYYSTVFPAFLKPIYKYYFKQFMKVKDMKKTYFALGLIGQGIFGDEQIYKDINEFKKDVNFFYSQHVENLVIFELSAITKRENSDEWVSYLKSLSDR